MRGRLGAVAEVWRDPDLRRVVVGFGLFSMAEFGVWMTMLVYAYDEGGSAGAGLAAAVQLVPAGLLAPFLSVLSDRRRRDRVLAGGFLVQSAAMLATAGALLLDAPFPVVIGFAAVVTTSITATRPAQAAVLPLIARTPDALTAANVATGLLGSLGVFLGPGLAALLLGIGPQAVFLVYAVGLGIAGAICLRLRTDPSVFAPPIAGMTEETDDVRMGIGTVFGSPQVRAVAFVLILAALVYAGVEILLVAVAIDLLGIGGSGAGALNSALGLGEVVGAAASIALVGRRLAPAIALGCVAFGAPLAAAAGIPSVVAVPLLLLCAGGGNAITHVAGTTLLQRAAPDEVRGRVFGTLEGLTTLALATGSVAAAILLGTVGVRGALLVAGAAVPAGMLLSIGRLLSIDRTNQPDPLRLAFLRGIDMFAPLPPFELEGLALALQPVSLAAGEAIMRQGDPGDRFYVLATGELRILKDGAEVARCRPGGYVGEIALLRNVPRTATVVADVDSTLLALERHAFLAAVTGHEGSTAVADRVVAARTDDGTAPPTA